MCVLCIQMRTLLNGSSSSNAIMVRSARALQRTLLGSIQKPKLYLALQRPLNHQLGAGIPSPTVSQSPLPNRTSYLVVPARATTTVYPLNVWINAAKAMPLAPHAHSILNVTQAWFVYHKARLIKQAASYSRKWVIPAIQTSSVP